MLLDTSNYSKTGQEHCQILSAIAMDAGRKPAHIIRILNSIEGDSEFKQAMLPELKELDQDRYYLVRGNYRYCKVELESPEPNELDITQIHHRLSNHAPSRPAVWSKYMSRFIPTLVADLIEEIDNKELRTVNYSFNDGAFHRINMTKIFYNPEAKDRNFYGYWRRIIVNSIVTSGFTTKKEILKVVSDIRSDNKRHAPDLELAKKQTEYLIDKLDDMGGYECKLVTKNTLEIS